MQPRRDLIKIVDNKAKIRELLSELIVSPRLNTLKWSELTKQTPNIKVGYPAQHLASLITGMEGERTGARGNDLSDGSEVKACSRIDQLDKCKEEDCGAAVARSEARCPVCGSSRIDRRDDSKWLFTIRSDDDLRVLTREVSRVLLIIGDYPEFDAGNFETLRFQAFEIWPQSERQVRFAEIMTNYYKNIYLVHKQKNAAKTPAPKNFWPFSYQFYICNPILTFSGVVRNANAEPKIDISYYVEPAIDRSNIPAASMPVDLLSEEEFATVVDSATSAELMGSLEANRMFSPTTPKGQIARELKFISEALRRYLPLRDDRTAEARTKHTRRRN